MKRFIVYIVIVLFVFSFTGCNKFMPYANEGSTEASVILASSNSSTSNITGKWRAKKRSGENIRDYILEYMFFENGKVFVMSNNIENGIQLSVPEAIRAFIMDYTYKNNILVLDNRIKARVDFINTNLRLSFKKDMNIEEDAEEDVIVILNKEGSMQNIVGKWYSHLSDNFYITTTINQDLSATMINEQYTGNDIKPGIAKYILEKCNMYDIEFDGRYIIPFPHNISRFFLLDTDRIIVVNRLEGSNILEPTILQRKKR
jgi:hypothetical protein